MASNDSEDEFTLLDGRWSSFISALSELRAEMDESKFYKMLDDLIHEFIRSARVPMKSKAVQTDPEASGIPPSTLMAAEDLDKELKKDLGNFINTLLHNPNGYCKEGTQQGSNPRRLQYFTYVDGCWQSTLFPSIEIPASIMPFWNEYVKETASKEESQRKEQGPGAKNDATKIASGDAGHAVCTATCSTLSVDVPRPVNASRLLEQGVAVSKYYRSTGSIAVQSNPNSFAVKKRQIQSIPLADNVRSNQRTKSERMVEGQEPNRRRKPLTQISESDVSCPYNSPRSRNDLKVKKSIKNNGNINKPTNDQENSKGVRVNFIKRNILAVKSSAIRGLNV